MIGTNVHAKEELNFIVVNLAPSEIKFTRNQFRLFNERRVGDSYLHFIVKLDYISCENKILRFMLLKLWNYGNNLYENKSNKVISTILNKRNKNPIIVIL